MSEPLSRAELEDQCVSAIVRLEAFIEYLKPSRFAIYHDKGDIVIHTLSCFPNDWEGRGKTLRDAVANLHSKVPFCASEKFDPRKVKESAP